MNSVYFDMNRHKYTHTLLTSCLTGNVHHLLHLSCDVFLWLLNKLWWFWGT